MKQQTIARMFTSVVYVAYAAYITSIYYLTGYKGTLASIVSMIIVGMIANSAIKDLEKSEADLHNARIDLQQAIRDKEVIKEQLYYANQLIDRMKNEKQ